MQRAWAFKPKISPSTQSIVCRACYQTPSSSHITSNVPVLKTASTLSNSPTCRSFSSSTIVKGARWMGRGMKKGRKPFDKEMQSSGSKSRKPSSPVGRSAAKSNGSRKGNVQQNMRDTESLAISKLDLPTARDFPTMNVVLQDPVERLKPTLSLFQGFSEKSSSASGQAKVEISLTDPVGGLIQEIGTASTTASARKLAYLRVLAALHAKGLAGAAMPLSKNLARNEKNSILDVYLYAARYGDVPKVESNMITTGQGKRSATHCEVNVELPLLGVKTVGRAKNLNLAEISAGLNTKQAIQHLLQQNELKIEPVPEDEIFTLGTGAAFCQWYQYSARGISIDYDTQAGDIVVRSRLVMKTGETKRVFPEVNAGNRKDAESLAGLAAALTLTQEDPKLRTKFFKEFKKNNGQVLIPVSPVTFDMADETFDAIRRSLEASKAAIGRLDVREDAAIAEDRIRTSTYAPLSEAHYQRKSENLKKRIEAYKTRDDLAKLRKTRSEYPMNQYAEEVLKTVNSSTYSIVIGATGSGKTTQVPQIILNAAIESGEGAGCNIICTQPRRIAAKSVAQRVADERAEFLGDCVGYHVKKDVRTPTSGGSINFCTTGILTTQLQFMEDNLMDNVSHIIVDEVHERDTIIDFLLTTLKQIVKRRTAEGKKVPHIILMSATIDKDLFADYLKIENAQGETIECPTMFVPGRTFPVKEIYLEDVMKEIEKTGGNTRKLLASKDTGTYIDSERQFARDNRGKAPENDHESVQDTTINWAEERKKATRGVKLMSVEEQEQALVPHELVAETIAHIAKSTNEGAILTFLPGLDDITKVDALIREMKGEKSDFNDTSKYKIFMLHSSIQHTQQEVFEPVPPGCRKVILATNIAETSITIPDVQHVVDTGKLRELQYDQTRRITKLACVWVSKSNAKQRAGRAGRVQDGNYYALYSRERYDSLRPVGLPELLRSDLQEICLSIKNQGYDVPVKQFLSETIEPPTMESIDLALENLIGLQALDEKEVLTPLGKLLASLPTHPSLGKMIVLGIIFRCLDPMLIIGASFGERALFVSPLERKKEANEARQKFAKNTLSDHIGLLSAVKEMRMLDEVRGPRALQDYAMRNYLHLGAYRSITSTAQSIEQLLAEHGVISKVTRINRAQCQYGDPQLNTNSDKVGLIKALVLAGFYPNLGVRKGRFNYRTPREGAAMVHPSSVNAVDLKKFRSKRVQAPPIDPRTELLTFSELVRAADGNAMYLRGTTPVTPLTSVLFSGNLEMGRTRNMLQMDDWLPFYLKSPQEVALVLRLHHALQKVTSAAFQDLAARRVLADHQDRNVFADTLVAVLDADLISSARQSRPAYPASASGSGYSKPAASTAQRQENMRPAAENGNKKIWDDLIASWSKRNGPVASAGSMPPAPLFAPP